MPSSKRDLNCRLHFSRRLKIALVVRGMSHKVLLYKLENIGCKVIDSTVTNWTRGKHMPEQNRVQALCTVLECSQDWLLLQEDVKLRIGENDAA